MRKTSWFLVGLIVVLLPVIAGCFASTDRVDSLERRIQTLESQQARQVAQQQHSAAEINRQLTDLKTKANEIDQRLSELGATDTRLFETDAEMREAISEMESRLDARAINKVMATPWQYFAIVSALFLLGTLVGVYGFRLSSRDRPS